MLLVPNKHLETPNYKLERLRHDDPRLENLQASYTMIEEPDDEVGITRREKAKAKQEPVIKGILPEQPAPVAPPKAEPVAAPVAAEATAPHRPPRRLSRGSRLLRLDQADPGHRSCGDARTGGGAGLCTWSEGSA